MSRKFAARLAECAKDVRAAQALRGRVFRGGGLDQDHFDEDCLHVLVEDSQDQHLVCAFRLRPFNSGAELDAAYAAQYYELSGLKGYKGKLLEMGRFCIDPNYADPDILRTAWAAMTTYVDAHNIEMLFGCSSFSGTKTEAHLEAFAHLKAHHLAPHKYRPKIKAPQVFDFSQLTDQPPRPARIPPLLRTYLMMGGWTSDHAVIDQDLNTLHVLTGLEIAAIPESRKRLLRAIAN